MARHIPSVRDILDSVVYATRLSLLTVLGPAQLDDEHDPIQRLKAEHRARHR